MKPHATAWFHVSGGHVDVLKNSERSCGLPGIDCAACGNTWATLGIDYPTLSCADLSVKLPADLWPVRPEVYAKLQDALRAALGDDRPLGPGTSFGPIVSPLKRLPPDIFHPALSFLISEKVAENPALAELGLRLARTPLETVRGKKVVMYELEAWAVAERERRASDRVKPPCPVCGFVRYPPFRNEPLVRASLGGQHAVRLAELPAILFVSAELKSVLERYAPGELTYKAARVA